MPNLSLSPELLDAAVELLGRSGRIGRLRVRGTSMVPTLFSGQIVAVDFAPERLARGDVLLFRLDELLVVHRMIGRAARDGRSYFRARGDGRIRLDPPVWPERVVGRVIALLDEDGWRSTRGRPARVYAWLVAWHDYAWAAVAVVGRVVERVLRRLRVPVHVEARVRQVDRWLLHRAHALLYARVHPHVSPPDDPDAP